MAGRRTRPSPESPIHEARIVMEGTSLQDRLILVGGAPRSGTTLLQNMLGSHSEILGSPEFLHLRDIVGLRNRLRASIDEGWIEAFCGHDDVDRLTRGLITDLFAPLLAKHEARLLSQKTPGDVLVFDELLDLFPTARFLYTVRDPRAVVASLLRVGRKGRAAGRSMQSFTRDVRKAANHVRACMEAGIAARRRAPDRALEVAYERLVTEPAAESRRICSFLGVEWEEAMLYPSRQQHLGMKPITSRSQNVWYDEASFRRDPEPTDLDRWKRELTPTQRVTIIHAFRGFESDDAPVLTHELEDLSSLARLRGRLGFTAERVRSALSRRWRRSWRWAYDNASTK